MPGPQERTARTILWSRKSSIDATKVLVTPAHCVAHLKVEGKYIREHNIHTGCKVGIGANLAAKRGAVSQDASARTLIWRECSDL